MTTDKLETGGPAFPYPHGRSAEQIHGMSARTYAAIHLGVPQSEHDWINDMIRESQRNELAKAAMSAFMVASSDHSGTHPQCDEKVAERAYELADAMLAEQEKK